MTDRRAAGRRRAAERRTARDGEAGRDRSASDHRRAGRDAALEVARASDLRRRPALVRCLRDRGGACRPGGASASAAHLVLPISIAIAAVLGDRRPLLHADRKAYETSGGAYVVAKDNLGTLPSLVAAAAAPGRLRPDRLGLRRRRRARDHSARRRSRRTRSSSRSLLILLLTVVNLRGVRESGIAFALPTYAFVAVMYVMIGAGFAKCASAAARRRTPPIRSRPARPAASACSSSSGRSPRALRRSPASSRSRTASAPSSRRRAGTRRRTLLVMGGMAISLFLGVSWLAVHMHALPSDSVSVISEIARATFPGRLTRRRSCTTRCRA